VDYVTAWNLKLNEHFTSSVQISFQRSINKMVNINTKN
jgi:hypothetical protein